MDDLKDYGWNATKFLELYEIYENYSKTLSTIIFRVITVVMNSLL